MGRWSRGVAAGFVRWLAVPPGAAWLDVGCGTGALSQAVVAAAEPRAVVGVDASPELLEEARRHLAEAPVRLVVADAAAVPLPDAAVDVAVSGLVLNFLPDVGAALAELGRVTRPGGTVAAYVWDYAGGMEMVRHFWDVATALDEHAADLDQARRSPVCRPGPLAEAWTTAGFRDVEVAPVRTRLRFASFADYWDPFLGGQGGAPRYLATLSDGHRERVREVLRERLVPGGDGPFALGALAWAVRGHR